MISYIYQVGLEPQDELNPFNIINGKLPERVPDDERIPAIKELVAKMPKKMFQYKDKKTIIYKGGIKEWFFETIENVKKRLDYIAVDNDYSIQNLENIGNALHDPLGSMDKFCFHSIPSAEPSIKLFQFLWNIPANTEIHIGSVMEYNW